jgi:hypothetical protein
VSAARDLQKGDEIVLKAVLPIVRILGRDDIRQPADSGNEKAKCDRLHHKI